MTRPGVVLVAQAKRQLDTLVYMLDTNAPRSGIALQWNAIHASLDAAMKELQGPCNDHPRIAMATFAGPGEDTSVAHGRETME